MPEIVEIEVAASDVARGDVLLGTTGELLSGARAMTGGSAVVTAVTRGSRNVTIATSEGEVYLRAEAPVTVRREQESEAEYAARRREFGLRQLVGLVHEWATDPRTVLAREMEKFEPGRSGQLLDSWRLDEFLSAQAQYGVAARILAIAERQAKRPELADTGWDEGEMLLTAVAIVVDGWRERRGARRVLSRSTSVTSNLLEDLDVWALEEFQDKLRWGTDSLVDARIAELKEMFGER